VPNRFVERFPPSAQASMARCILCDAVELGHVCPYATGGPVPPVVAAAGAWSERFGMFAFVALFGSIVSAFVVQPVLVYLLPFALLCMAASVIFRAIPWLFARSAPAAQAIAAAAEADPRIALRAALLRARGRISPALSDRLRRVRGTIEEGLAHADKATTGDLDTHILRESALHYVPEAIDYYLSLPPNAPRTLEGRTAEQELDYQLALIEERVQKVLDGKARDLVDDFEAHGRFLRERLSAGSGALDIPTPVSSPEAAERERVRAQ
jgi:hypothetical protein